MLMRPEAAFPYVFAAEGAQHPPLPPLSNQRSHKLPPTYLQSDSSNERVLRNGLHPASILDFKAKLANRCRVLPVYTLFRASILDFKAKLGNRCKDFSVYPLLRASILDFRARLGNRCKVFPVYGHSRASILDFRGSIWESLQVFPSLRLFACSDS